MVNINFPMDFRVIDNSFLSKANYIHQRPDMSVISVLVDFERDAYEVWDERFMEYPIIMSYEELNTYLNTPLTNLLANQFCSSRVNLN